MLINPEILRTKLSELDNWSKIPVVMQDEIIKQMTEDDLGLIKACENIIEWSVDGNYKMGNLSDYKVLLALRDEGIRKRDEK